jgi:hypothetical protein
VNGLSPDVAASVLRAAADAGVPVEAPPRDPAVFDQLWAAARISTPASEVDDETWLAREQLKAYIVEHRLTGGWLEDVVFGPAVTLIQPYTVLRDAPRRRRR